MDITFNDLEINIRSNSSWKPGCPAMMTLETRDSHRIEFYVEACPDKWKQLEEIAKLCQEMNAYEAYLQGPDISYF